MNFIEHTKPHLLIAEKGKKLRLKEDIYKEATEEQEEHVPYYSNLVFPADNLTEQQVREMYVEEAEV